jgi:diadenosine tetraphosphate (Ap4A) HIT family hydrolase
VDRGSGLFQFPTQGIAPAQGCWSCAIVQSVANQRTVAGASYVTEAANEDVVVLRGPEFAGLVVIPRLCISGLEQLPALDRARVLAAVRRATLLVRQANQGSTSRIVALTDQSAPEGHVSFQVLPNGSDDSTGHTPSSFSRASSRRTTAVAKAGVAR